MEDTGAGGGVVGHFLSSNNRHNLVCGRKAGTDNYGLLIGPFYRETEVVSTDPLGGMDVVDDFYTSRYHRNNRLSRKTKHSVGALIDVVNSSAGRRA